MSQKSTELTKSTKQSQQKITSFHQVFFESGQAHVPDEIKSVHVKYLRDQSGFRQRLPPRKINKVTAARSTKPHRSSQQSQQSQQSQHQQR